MKRGAALLAMHCLLVASIPAHARQGAGSTALTLASGNVDIHADNVAVLLDGRTVRITVDVSNDEARTKRVGFYAYTPFFWYLGTGDEYQDKSFPEVQATLNGHKLAPVTKKRGFHLGQDITEVLARNGIAPLPDHNANAAHISKLPILANMRPTEWQGFVTFSWTFDVVRGSRNALSFTYSALPEFALTTAESGLFARKIRQHCGNVAQVIAALARFDAKASEYIVYRYDIPVMFLQNGPVSLTVKQPDQDADGARPVISLACSDTPTDKLSSAIVDTVHDAGNSLSILVISLPERTNN